MLSVLSGLTGFRACLAVHGYLSPSYTSASNLQRGLDVGDCYNWGFKYPAPASEGGGGGGLRGLSGLALKGAKGGTPRRDP